MNQVRRFPRPRRLTRWLTDLWIMALVASGVLITVYFGLESVPYTERKHLVLMSNVMERDLGDFLFKVAKGKFIKDKILPPYHPYSIRVQSIFEKIFQTMQRGLGNEHNRLNWEVLVVDSPTITAFCMLGGKIVVHTELLKHFDSDEAIAWIVGHEVAHIVARHGQEAVIKDIGLLLIWVIIFPCIEGIYRLYIRRARFLCTVTTFCFVYVMLILLVRLPSSRRRELEADYIGMQLMASAGYDPRLAIIVSKRLGEILGEYYPLNDILSTHPSAKKRAQALARADVIEEAFARYRQARGLPEETRNRDRNHFRRRRKEKVTPFKDRKYIVERHGRAVHEDQSQVRHSRRRAATARDTHSESQDKQRC